MRMRIGVFLASAVIFCSCVPPGNVPSQDGGPNGTIAPTIRPTEPMPIPTATAVQTATVTQRTNVFSGPGNKEFAIIDNLEVNDQVDVFGEFGDFVMVSWADRSDEHGFVWKETIGNLETRLPQLNITDLPQVELDLIEKFYDPRTLNSDGKVEVSTGVDQWMGPSVGPIFVDGPFQIQIARSFHGDFGAIQLMGNLPPFLSEDIEKVESGEMEWPIPQLIIGPEGIEIADEDLSSGSSPIFQRTEPRLSTDSLTVIFHDARGKSFSIHDSENEELISLDVADLDSDVLKQGLFPEKLYAGILVGPSTEMEVSRMTLQQAPSGEYSQDDRELTLRKLADENDLLIGTGTVVYHLGDLINASTMADEFNTLVVAQIAWDMVEPEPDVYDFSKVDAMIAFAEDNEMMVQCSDIIRPADIPDWVRTGDYSREELTDILRGHVFRLLERYHDRCDVWTVINEQTMQSAFAPEEFNLVEQIGLELYEMVFRWAHEADPDAVLLYKDTDGYDRESYWTRTISDEMYRIVKDLLDKDVPVDGVAFQLHLLLADTNHVPTRDGVKRNLQRFADLGLDVYLDEVDVNLGSVTGSQEERWNFQADLFREMLEACLDVAACRSFSLFDYTDRHSWLGDCEGCRYVPNSEAHIFDKHYNPKPAYFALYEVLSENLSTVK